MKILLIVVGALLIVGTVLPLLRKEAWWVRIFDFPRLQITVLTAITLGAYLLWLFLESDPPNILEIIFLAVLSICLLYQAYRMYPYTILSPKQVLASHQPNRESGLSILFANVKMDNHQSAALREIIKEADPDIILAVEPDDWWEAELRVFEETYPYVVHQPQDNYYGMLLYSRLELIDPEVNFLVQEDVPSIHSWARLPSGDRIEFYCLHPRPPSPNETGGSLERDVELITVGKAIKVKQTPVIVFGDLNDVAWSHTNNLFQKISGLLDPRIGRGFFNSFHARFPLVRFPLDHFFHTDHFKLIHFQRLRYFGSDHFPMFIALTYEPETSAEQLEAQADRDDRQEAEEKLEKAS